MLTVFTVADERYEPFVLPYALSVLVSNPSVTVEIAIESTDRFMQTFADAHRLVAEAFPGQFVLTEADFTAGRDRAVPANSVRFLLEPSVRNDYVYVGDIDILVLDDILALHLPNMERLGLSFSNILRPGRNCLSGLHFSAWDALYPIVVPDHALVNLDEHLLYEIVHHKGVAMPPRGEAFRPVMGYHLSLQCDPRGSPKGWGGIGRKAYVERYAKLRDHDVWKALLPLLPLRYRVLVALLETHLGARFPDMFDGAPLSPGTRVKELWNDIEAA